VARVEGHVRSVAAVRGALVVESVGEAGHVEVEFLSNAHFAEVRGDLEPRFEGADAVPCHGVGAREGVHRGRDHGGRVLEESLVYTLSLFQIFLFFWDGGAGHASGVKRERPKSRFAAV